MVTKKIKYILTNSITVRVHHNPLLIRNRSWILTIHKARILRKKPLEKTFLDFKKWVKSIQTAGYNCARMVDLNRYRIKSGFVQMDLKLVNLNFLESIWEWSKVSYHILMCVLQSVAQVPYVWVSSEYILYFADKVDFWVFFFS